MLLDLVLFVLGLAGLVAGAEWLVGGAARMAAKLGVSSFVVGLTLVSFGTSAPELVVSGLASYRGNGALAVGNVLGSNVANIALILGIAALIRGIDVRRELLVRDIPIMIGVTILVPLLGLSGSISRWEGVVLLVIFVAYVTHVARMAHRESGRGMPLGGDAAELDESERRGSLRKDALIAFVGLVVLAVGAHLLVQSAVSVATALNVPEVVIGLTLVAFGTSLPELAASVSAARRNEGEIVIGNIVGSNIFNVALILGIGALVRPLPISEAVLRVDAPVVIALSILLLPMAFWGKRIARWEGGLLCAGYAAFIAWNTL